MSSLKTQFILILFVTSFVSGCNTVGGIGKDLEGAGESIQEIAEDIKSTGESEEPENPPENAQTE